MKCIFYIHYTFSVSLKVLKIIIFPNLYIQQSTEIFQTHSKITKVSYPIFVRACVTRAEATKCKPYDIFLCNDDN
jgi:hypothetical protein